MSQSQKTRAIEGLLTEPTIGAAAKAAGVSRRTLARWLDEEAFQQDLRTARDQSHGLALARICAAAGEAVDVLLKGLRGEQIAKQQYLCARAILDAGQQARELEIEDRLQEIERQIGQMENTP